tara:strand:- start:7 stop:246 length:240 start_codon:yes stop_codon:yes gene_type:complete
MAYIAYYKKKTNSVPSVRYMTRGFSCTRDELPREIAIRCGAIPDTLQYFWVADDTDAAEIFIQDGKDKGYAVDNDAIMV